MTSPLKLIIKELEVYYGQTFKGRIFTGNPSRGKPRDVPLDEWCASIVRLSALQWKSRVCIPRSFFSSQEKRHDYLTQPDRPRYLALVDDLGSIGECQPSTPADDVREIIECLTRGDDILILSQTRKISGFLPAILAKLCHSNWHVIKLLWTLEHHGYEITEGQRGYIVGLRDAVWLHSLNSEHDDFDSKVRKGHSDETRERNSNKPTFSSGTEEAEAMEREYMEAEANGYLGLHVYDVGVEDPPHPDYIGSENQKKHKLILAARARGATDDEILKILDLPYPPST